MKYTPDHMQILNDCLEKLKVFGVNASPEDIRGRVRNEDLIFMRVAVVAYLRAQGYSNTKIGTVINRGPCDVLHLRKKVKAIKKYRWNVINAINKNDIGEILTKELIHYHQSEIDALKANLPQKSDQYNIECRHCDPPPPD